MTVTPPPIVVRTMSKDGAAQLSISLQPSWREQTPKERTLLRAAPSRWPNRWRGWPPAAAPCCATRPARRSTRRRRRATRPPPPPRSTSTPRRARCGIVRPRCSSSTCPSRPLSGCRSSRSWRRRAATPTPSASWERRVEPSASWAPIARSGGILFRPAATSRAAPRARVPPPPRGVGRGGGGRAPRPHARAAGGPSAAAAAVLRRAARQPRERRRSAGEYARVLSYNLLADAYRHRRDDPGGVHSFCAPALTAAANRLPAPRRAAES